MPSRNAGFPDNDATARMFSFEISVPGELGNNWFLPSKKFALL